MIRWMKSGPEDVSLELGARVLPSETGDPLDSAEVLFGCQVPDWVKIPDEAPKYAGEKRRVVEAGMVTCSCGTEHDVVALALDGPGRLVVLACELIGMALVEVPGDEPQPDVTP